MQKGWNGFPMMVQVLGGLYATERGTEGQQRTVAGAICSLQHWLETSCSKMGTGMLKSQKIGRGNQTSIPLLLEENWMFLN
jgi:hypothetical protein